MKTIKIKLKIELTNPEAVEALNTLLTIIGSNKVPTTEPKISKEQKVKPLTYLEKTVKKAIEEVKQEETLGDEAEDTVEIGLQLPEATLEEIREALGKKVSDHREKIKAKLTELDAKNVSVLSEKHYDNFKTFLDSL